MTWFVLFSLLAQDLPGGVTKKLETLREAVKSEREAATAVMLGAFDNHLKKIENAPGMNAEARLEQLAAVQAERNAFDKRGTLPLSLGMRDASKAYLGRVGPAESRLMKELNRGATIATKEGQTGLANKLLDEKNAIPTIVARYRCTYSAPSGRVSTWEFHLYSDGTVNRNYEKWNVHPKSWSYGPSTSTLVIINVTSESPKGGFKDVCKLDPDGRGFDATNQLGGKYRGVRLD